MGKKQQPTKNRILNVVLAGGFQQSHWTPLDVRTPLLLIISFRTPLPGAWRHLRSYVRSTNTLAIGSGGVEGIVTVRPLRS